MELAREHRLPDRIRDFIAEHHGLRVVKGFYRKAVELAGDEEQVDVARFRYPGPRPRSRESGIVMLADAVEATSSAVRPNTGRAIEKLVNSIVRDDVVEGQLDESGLTLGDIEQIRISLIESLKGRFHVRVRYPGNEALVAENVSEPDNPDQLPDDLAEGNTASPAAGDAPAEERLGPVQVPEAPSAG